MIRQYNYLGDFFRIIEIDEENVRGNCFVETQDNLKIQ